MQVIELLRLNEDDSIYINTLGFTDQMFFDKIQDAFYYLMLNHESCKMIVEKRSSSFFKIKIEYGYDNKSSYYQLRITNTLSYE